MCLRMCMSWTVWVTLLGVLLRSVYSPDGLGKETLSQYLCLRCITAEAFAFSQHLKQSANGVMGSLHDPTGSGSAPPVY